MRSRVLAIAVVTAALAGCASFPVFEGGRAWNEGWREGEVEKIDAARELGYQQSCDCRYRAGGAGRAAPGRFAVIGINDTGRNRHHVVPVEPGREPQVGADVLTNWRGCDPPSARDNKFR